MKFVFGIDVMHYGLQNVHTESPRSQLLIKGCVDDPLENGNNSPEFVGVGGDLGNCSVNAEVKSSLYLELLNFIANILDHFVQLVEMLFVQPDDVSRKIRLLFLGFNDGLQLGDLDRVVGGQRECSSGSDERGDVSLSSLSFWNVPKACQKILEKFEDLMDVRFV